MTSVRVLRRDERGISTAVEMILAVMFILLPLFALLAQAPKWAEASTAATAAASEAARGLAVAPDAWSGEVAARQIAADVVAARGFASAQLEDVAVSGTLERGAVVTATVRVRTDAMFIPGVGEIGAGFTITRSASERVDDYRGFRP